MSPWNNPRRPSAPEKAMEVGLKSEREKFWKKRWKHLLETFIFSLSVCDTGWHIVTYHSIKSNQKKHDMAWMMPDYSNCDCDSCDSGYVVLAGILCQDWNSGSTLALMLWTRWVANSCAYRECGKAWFIIGQLHGTVALALWIYIFQLESVVSWVVCFYDHRSNKENTHSWWSKYCTYANIIEYHVVWA